MAKDRFDDEIRDLLGGHTPEYDASSWDKLSQTLDEMDGEGEADFEPMMKEKLESYTAPLKESHWLKFKEELEALERRRYRLWAIKLTESVIVLLLLFTYWNYTQLKSEKTDNIHYAAVEENTIESESQSSNPIVALNASQQEGIHQEQTSIAASEDFKTINGSTVAGEILSVNTSSTIEERAFDKAKSVYSTIGDLLSTLSAPINDQSTPMQSEAIAEESNLNLFDHDYFHSIARIALSPFDLTLPIVAYAPEQVVIINNLNTKSNSQDGFWLSIPVSQDFNFVNSAINLDYFASQVSSGVYGSSIGILGSYMKGSIELETGLRYSDKSYAPGLLRSFSKASADTYLESQLDFVRFNQLQVPVVVKLHALSDSRVNLYSMAGFAINGVLDYDYNIRKSVQPSARVTFFADEPQLDIANLPEGILEGGRAQNNMFVTGVLGLGVQTQMPNGAALFFQPQYQFSVIGDLNDYVRNVNTLSIEAGIKFKF